MYFADIKYRGSWYFFGDEAELNTHDADNAICRPIS
jgi:hypothetical protein